MDVRSLVPYVEHLSRISAAIAAMEHGDSTLIERLIGRLIAGEELDLEATYEGQTALHIAVKRGRIDIVKKILIQNDYGWDPDHKVLKQNHEGELPLRMLAYSPSEEMALLLLDYGSPFNSKVTTTALLPSPRSLLDDPIFKETAPGKLLSKIRLLFELVEKADQFELFKELFQELKTTYPGYEKPDEEGQTPNARVFDWIDQEGDTILHRAASTGNLHAAQFLYQQNANCTLNLKKQRPATVAFMNGHWNIVAFFMSQKAGIWEEDITAMKKAKTENKLVKAYLSAFGQIELEEGVTLGTIMKDYPVLDWYHYQIECDSNSGPKSGWINILQHTLYHGDLEDARIICQHGGRFETNDFTYLVWSYTPINTEIVTLMLNHGATLNYDEEGAKYVVRWIARLCEPALLEMVLKHEHMQVHVTKELIDDLLCRACDYLNYPNVVYLVNTYNPDIHTPKRRDYIHDDSSDYSIKSMLEIAVCGFDDLRGDRAKDFFEDKYNSYSPKTLEKNLIKIIKFLNEHRFNVKAPSNCKHRRAKCDDSSVAYLLNLGHPLERLNIMYVVNESCSDTQQYSSWGGIWIEFYKHPQASTYLSIITKLFAAAEDKMTSLDDFQKAFNNATHHLLQQRLHQILLSLDKEPALSTEKGKEEKKDDVVMASNPKTADFYRENALQWVNKEGMTLLHIAAKRQYESKEQLALVQAQEQVAIFQFLLEQGFDPNKQTNTGQTVQDVARQQGKASLAAYHYGFGCYYRATQQYLLAAECFNNIEIDTPFHFAACQGLSELNDQLTKEMLKNGITEATKATDVMKKDTEEKEGQKGKSCKRKGEEIPKDPKRQKLDTSTGTPSQAGLFAGSASSDLEQDDVRMKQAPDRP
jgi:ankyrin repeat protein